MTSEQPPEAQQHPDEDEMEERHILHLRRINLLLAVLALTISLSLALLWIKVWIGPVFKVTVPPDTTESTYSVQHPDTLSTTTYKDRLRWGDNLASALSRNATDHTEIETILPIVQHLTDLKRIPVNTQITIERDELGLRSLILREPKKLERIHLNRTGRLLYVARVDTIPVDTLLVRYQGVVTDNFYNSFLRSGGTPALAVKYMEVFQFVYYFSSETRPGDRYHLIAEELWQEGKRIGYDEVLAADYISNDDTLTAVWMPIERSEFGGEHFDGQGRSLRRALLRVPFSAARVTSTYGIRRDPITSKLKFHHGVDLAAKMGMPVVAAGSGTITRVGRNDPGYGNWIHIKHDRTGFETRYGHLKGFARGIRKGLKVRQGQVIGYVGMTGHATGPHLHYEVFRDGKRLNPLRTKASPVRRLQGDELAEFQKEYYKPWMLRLDNRGVLPGPQWYGPLPEKVEQAMRTGSGSDDHDVLAPPPGPDTN